MTVSNFLVAISNAPWTSLVDQFAAASAYLETVAVASGVSFVAHETKECHVNWGHSELKGFEMETEILSKTVEDLTDTIKQYGTSIWMRVRNQ